ncbi:hypothetical protein TeGR_g3527 [Tetraparma gracilis]|uniref:Uncharacterized protein n=1 Tax=Tetraparma gracilis TaxID=2962635 RepID=A0ABQ6MP88_9STRA|nr:hypothetical protein TeGR_g3527 [Tetraparma gracilis]
MDSRHCRPLPPAAAFSDDSGEEDPYRPDFADEESSGDDMEGLDDDDDDDDLGVAPPRRSSAAAAATATAAGPPRSSSSSPAPPKYSPPPRAKADDLHPEDFDERLEAWLREKKERGSDAVASDSPEAPPGEALLRNNLRVPAYLNDRLFEYQRTGVRWMWELHTQGAGGIVGDEMGLGKTVQVAAFLGAMAVNRKVDSILIISPATMLQHWLTEMARWAPGIRRVLLHKSGDERGEALRGKGNRAPILRHLEKWLKAQRATLAREEQERARERATHAELFGEPPALDVRDEFKTGAAYVVVTTYESLKRSDDNPLLSHPWTYVVMDEGQKIRNPDTEVTLATKSLRTVHRLLLSGTPIQNNLRELWSLFDFVFPGRLGTLPAFEQEFSDPIKVGGYANATPMQVQLAYRCALVLKDLINPYLLRRQKKDIAEVERMPGKTEQVLFCRLSPRQRDLYQSYIMGSEVQAVHEGRMRCFKPIGVLRKLCNHPDLVCGNDDASRGRFKLGGAIAHTSADFGDGGDDNDDSDEDVVDLTDDDFSDDGPNSFVNRSGKLQILSKILPLWKKEGHRVLIFCQTRQMLTLIERFVQRRNLTFRRMDGNTAVGARQGLVDRFNNDPSIFGMLLTTKTGGVGVNFVGANRIILFDPDWNPQTDKQANERAWRFGQKKDVTVYRLITAGTIEEKIYHRQIFKTALSNKILQDPRQRRLFSHNDLKDFFTLKADTMSVDEGGDGFTETGDLMLGKGVMDEPVTSKAGSAVKGGEKEDATLEAVMKSKGLAGVFDHDFVDTSSDRSIAVREMEDKAKSIARRAAAAIKKSVADTNAAAVAGTGAGAGAGAGGTEMVPTFTGRFGGSGGAAADILAQISARQNEIATEGASRSSAGTGAAGEKPLALTDVYTRLMHRLKTFLVVNGGEHVLEGGGPTTDQILREFSDVPDRDAAIFKRMLTTLACRKGARWKLRE